jgi:PAS domain-containing protein
LLVSDYESGDVFARLTSAGGSAPSNMNGFTRVICKTGMATAASVYRFSGPLTELTVRVPLEKELAAMANPRRFDANVTWAAARSQCAGVQIPNKRMQALYDAAVHTLLLMSADELVPGPYTYRRFWFRDACLMLGALLALGLANRCRRAIERFPERQLRNGYFRSQEGEWDSNGQVLWIIDRYARLTGAPIGKELLASIDRAVHWIDRKRVQSDDKVLHAGLLPAGFSAEHLGPNDHYYWDDFWAEAGLLAAERIYLRAGRREDAENARRLANEMRSAIERSVERIPYSRSLGGIPASPYRRMDAGAVGSLVADYPLQLFPPGAPQIMATVDALMDRCFHSGAFFQDIIHSGINAYLTLDIAQTLLRAGHARFRDLLEAVAKLASPTGQWPEAIHPQTGGGCMGDGQHGWAAAEWVMMIRNMFVREEGNRLVVGSGLFEEWFETDEDLYFGPTLTAWGPITVRMVRPAEAPLLTIDAHWRDDPPRVDVEIPGFAPLIDVDCSSSIRLGRVQEGVAARSFDVEHSGKGQS